MRWDAPAPREDEAHDRSWEVVRSAWSSRSRHPRRPRVRRGPALALAAALAVALAALSPPGTAVLGSLRDAVRTEELKPALFALPDRGRLLVGSMLGTWIVQRDGSKRLLEGYRDAGWSPNGIYLAAVFGHEIRALEPDGTVHWSIARRGRLASPVWSDATPPCCRVAYLAGRQLRVVNGDGTGDRLVAERVADVAPAWRPRTHALAYVTAGGAIRVVDADTGRPLGAWRDALPQQLEWSSDGKLLAIREGGILAVYRPDGTRVVGMSTRSLAPGNPFTAVAFRPNSHTLAWSTYDPASDTSVVVGGPIHGIQRRIFTGAGRFASLAWSGDGRWLALDWPAADQLLFIRSTAVRKVVAITNVASSLGMAPTLRGWCCP